MLLFLLTWHFEQPKVGEENNTKKHVSTSSAWFSWIFPKHWAHNNGVPTGEPHSAPRIWQCFRQRPPLLHARSRNLNFKKNQVNVTTSGFFNFEIIFSTFNSKKKHLHRRSIMLLILLTSSVFSCPDGCFLYFDWFFLELCLTFSLQEFLTTSNQLNPRCTDRWQLANCNWLRRPLQDPTMIPRSIDLSFSLFFSWFLLDPLFFSGEKRSFCLEAHTKAQRVVLTHVDMFNSQRLIRIPKHHSCRKTVN